MKRIAWTICGVLVGTAAATAQTYPYPPGFYYGGGGGSYHHASTVEEGRARGMADVIRSSGAANMMNSEAAKNIEDARKKYIENRLQATQTYFEMKRINKEYRDVQRQPPPTQEQILRINDARRPDRLSSNYLDPLTGELAWPIALRDERFKDQRDAVETIYARRAEDGQLGPKDYLEVKRIAEDMRKAVVAMGDDLPSNMRIQSRKFLESLTYEASLQAG